MVRASIVGLLLCVSSPVFAQNTGAFGTGNLFQETCGKARNASNVRTAMCVGYIQGVREAGILLQQKSYCAPGGATNSQFYDVLLEYLQKNPADRHLPTVLLLTLSAQEAWPCSN